MNANSSLLIALAGLSLSCQSPNQSPVDPERGVALYLITAPANLGADAYALDTASITLSKDALIRYDAIENYATSTYTFRLDKKAVSSLSELSQGIPLSGKPFALAVDGTVVYYGLFWSPISSFNAAYPFIILDRDHLNGASNGIDLNVNFRAPLPGGLPRPDPRNDPRLLDRLRRDNKLT